MTRSGRLFQTRAAATGKALSPTADSRVRLTINDDDEVKSNLVIADISANCGFRPPNLPFPFRGGTCSAEILYVKLRLQVIAAMQCTVFAIPGDECSLVE